MPPIDGTNAAAQEDRQRAESPHEHGKNHLILVKTSVARRLEDGAVSDSWGR
jgi:hypothetical protein